MRRLIALLGLVALAGCGGEAPSSVVPADATIYVGLDASNAERLVTETSRADVDFEREVQPWLGDRAAYFANGPADIAGLVFETDDEEAAEAFGRKVTAAGPMRASAVIDGRLVVAATRDLLRAANAAADSGSLADSTRLDVAGEDGDDPPDILLAAEEPRAFAAGVEVYELPIPVEALAGDGPLTARVWEERIEVTGLAPAGAAPSLAGAPADASLAVASADLGEEVGEHWDGLGMDLERLLLPRLGAGSLVLRGRAASLVAETSDEAALRREAAALARRLGPKRADLNVADEFLQLETQSFLLLIEGGSVYLDTGVKPPGVAGDLDDTRRYRDAVRRLGGAPTLLTSSLAARRAGMTLRIVMR
jgi:hypothetical protein